MTTCPLCGAATSGGHACSTVLPEPIEVLRGEVSKAEARRLLDALWRERVPPVQRFPTSVPFVIDLQDARKMRP